MWSGSLRPVSVAPRGCQIAREKVICAADTAVVAGREGPRCLQEKQPVSPGSHTSFMDGGKSALKPLSAAGAALRKMPFLSYTVCHRC